ncbi:MAG TPA: undecaprenyl-diphosphate phosphatase [Clostridia bacterium]|nr:undecaprenyl-diphosphate phosphatase [Clostridia bacterium]
MTLIQALFLAILQGLTEFLPVSSSGHLVLFQKVFGFSQPLVFFDVLLHFGTLGSILVFFRKTIISLLKEWRKNLRVWGLLSLGSVPAAFFGFLLNVKIDLLFDSLWLLGGAWILFGLFLLSSRKLNYASKGRFAQASWLDSLIIGLSQAAALLPGISRSGSTITTGLWRQFSREEAFKFSFLLAIPAIFGATLLEIRGLELAKINLCQDISAMFLAGVMGYLSLKFLQKTLRSEKFYFFGFYCLLVGFLSLAMSLDFRFF